MTWDFSIWVVRSLAFGWVLHQLNCSEANLNLKLNLMFSCSPLTTTHAETLRFKGRELLKMKT